MTRIVCLVLIFISSTAFAEHWRGPRWHRRPPMDMTHLRALTDACNDAMEGRDNERRCLDTVSRTRRTDVPQLVRACEDAMEGDDNELACIATFANSRLQLPVVRACEDAMEGDPNELACMSAVIGSRYDAVELVRYCEENESGDAAELSCIGYWR